MTETERVVRLLARRMSLVGFANVVVSTDNHYYAIHARIPAKTGEVFLCAWVGEEGRVREVLSFLFPDKGREGASLFMGLHLNNWRRPVGARAVPELVDALWARFWEQEEENGSLDRLLWMRTSQLPPLDEPLAIEPVLERDSLDLLFEEITKPGPPPTPRARMKAPLLDIGGVLDMFEEP